ncbi:TonB-dependent receptor [Govanella unica]|uniref:TonB-dependent receptor n=1 Tax=Govanella unica TaxID=2975056 RepID=A0A9X3Z7V6_9PROT|nr:TonB-dependent receptor [Govania unica]MDA5194433.1 TonB-dependent receptor [Govania unica]
MINFTKFRSAALSASCLTLVSGAVAIPAFGPAFAQDKPAGEAGSFGIEEIIVTSQRRAESLQTVPIAITAFSASDIEKRHFNTALALVGQTPNLVIKTSQGEAKPTIFLRGMGFNDFNATAVGAVGVYNDEVYIGGASNQLVQMFDLERVEVLRGPQGTLYGRNTTGGAINFIARKPDNDLSATAYASYGRFNSVDLQGAIGGGLVDDKLSARVAGTYSRSDGDQFNEFTQKRAGGYEKWAGRLLLKLTPSDNTEFLLNVHGGNNDSDGTILHNEGLLPGGVDAFGFKETGGFYTIDQNLPYFTRIKSFGTSFTAKLDFETVSLTTISAYEQVKYQNRNDADASPLDFIDLNYKDRQHQFSQELRLASRGEGPWDWIIGGYYYTEDLKADNLYDIGQFARALGAVPDLDDPNAPLRIAQPYDQDSRSYAVFGQTSYAITEKVKATLGLRWTRDRKAMVFRTFADEPSLGFAPLIPETLSKNTWNAVTGRVGVDYQVTDDAMLYASYNRGYKSGGYNGGALFDPIEATPFNPEKVNAYEVGFKTRWLDNRLTLNGALFYNNYSDLQVFRFITGENGLPVTLVDNAASARIKGFELEASLVPVEGLRIDMGLGLLDAKYQDFITQAPDQTGNFVNIDLSGNRLVGAPKVTYSGSIEYAVPVTDSLVVTPRAEWSYTSKQFFDTSNDPLLSQDGYWLMNASLTLSSADSRYELAVWGRNILGEKYNLDKVPLANFGLNQVVRGTRSSYGVSLRFRY